MNKNKTIAVFDIDTNEIHIMNFKELKETILSILELYKTFDNNEEHINIIEKIEMIEDLKFYYEQNFDELMEHIELQLSDIHECKAEEGKNE